MLVIKRLVSDYYRGSVRCYVLPNPKKNASGISAPAQNLTFFLLSILDFAFRYYKTGYVRADGAVIEKVAGAFRQDFSDISSL